MNRARSKEAFILGIFIFLGLAFLGYTLGSSAVKIKEYERTVKVKGLSQKEFPADIIIWPIQFTVADNTLKGIYSSLDSDADKIKQFLISQGVPTEEISISLASVTDKTANMYGSEKTPEFRYTSTRTVTVYSKNVAQVREVMNRIGELGKAGIALTGNNYDNRIEYLFTRLNEVKPAMIEEATNKAREVATKFAEDSSSRLGKIKSASQGQFTIYDRDRNTPHIKKLRVVSTVEFYLSD
ncbi:protein of unknown function DUF541 [Denitrovibrio acetiphilus DSM 12809]|uniref:Periplasmic protein n=1 Tax=Denitrovibrio acetiphilus (strain DSM 12809 / NBRC 114555 / N2460) TaxID=522772 RepID=D4H2H6_DENA2|nr:SIMPL domain-containing protein [Denitrovibrio acetiphilus]ADD67037.1 protein of unknown function DUF541 [Denitrovibrio acetiphilus DSM 12809]